MVDGSKTREQFWALEGNQVHFVLRTPLETDYCLCRVNPVVLAKCRDLAARGAVSAQPPATPPQGIQLFGY